jgi:hypothetical protein
VRSRREVQWPSSRLGTPGAQFMSGISKGLVHASAYSIPRTTPQNAFIRVGLPQHAKKAPGATFIMKLGFRAKKMKSGEGPNFDMPVGLFCGTVERDTDLYYKRRRKTLKMKMRLNPEKPKRAITVEDNDVSEAPFSKFLFGGGGFGATEGGNTTGIWLKQAIRPPQLPHVSRCNN